MATRRTRFERIVALGARNSSTKAADPTSRQEANVRLFQILLMLATLLCSLVAGFLFAFAVVIMPGIRHLDDAGFIRSFQVIDRVIQNNQPLFMLMWVGSVLCLIAAAVSGLWTLNGSNRLILSAAAIVYLLCVQVPTAAINIPLNTELQKLEPMTMSDTARKRARDDFEPRWNRWNVVRTASASVTSTLLVIVLSRA